MFLSLDKCSSKMLIGIAVLGLFWAFVVGAVCVWAYLHRHNEIESSIRCEGTIVELKKRSNSDGAKFIPVFSYVDSKGIEHRCSAKWSSNPPAYKVGDKVNILSFPSKTNAGMRGDFKG